MSSVYYLVVATVHSTTYLKRETNGISQRPSYTE